MIDQPDLTGKVCDFCRMRDGGTPASFVVLEKVNGVVLEWFLCGIHAEQLLEGGSAEIKHGTYYFWDRMEKMFKSREGV